MPPAPAWVPQPEPVVTTTRTSARTKWIVAIGAAGTLFVVVLAVALSGGSNDPSPVATAEPHVVAVATPEPVKPAPRPEPVAQPEPAQPETAVVEAPPAPKAPKPYAPKPAKKVATAQPVVVDYDKPPDASTDTTHDMSLARARTSYTLANQHLFAGETALAIDAYRRAIAAYPNYAAGYRGLGLAYTQSNDKKNAISAFTTYLRLVPGAKDVALVKKRIARLQAP
jgi:hypothetical protein